ncbi:hypothetical protein K450DRAFT_234063 [Umbelopsis ramanniana AG]|uniref:C2H2-type domain-containing protein n=1 Tax=Umbelopsis ramanniana AG TaxID=1314678 RepID=A0AAD5HGE6_UMBRA|nr:uncharacterized protein K450DRAFT_234063 [Umbelopsis ramanniana AG]KAI8580983.1 hypothetical protein K450DRAFT_234063 [Umbelopsis ramanniana AG]
MASPILDRPSPSEPMRKDSTSSISLLLNDDNKGMDALAKAAFSAEANDHQLKPAQPPTSHLPTPQSPAVPFPPIMVSREDSRSSSTADKWSHTSSSPIRNSQSPPSTNATVSAAITSRSGYGSFPLKSASSDERELLSHDKPFVCKECDQTFSRPHNLKSHLATHSAERPYQCEVCQHQFRRHHDLKRHQKLHTGERPYVCNTCDRSFARLDALNRHRRAEGGSACNSTQTQRRLSQPQPQNANLPSNHRQDSIDSTTVIRTRPNVPELHIPHPESRPFDKESGRRALSLDEHGYRSEEKPSPFRASTYPDPNSVAGSHRPVLPPPQGTSQPPPPQPSQHEKQLEHRISHLMKHNRDLESQLERQMLLNNSRELERYKNRVHDLEVEIPWKFLPRNDDIWKL